MYQYLSLYIQNRECQGVPMAYGGCHVHTKCFRYETQYFY
jgi:hypothetical protein